MGSLEQQLKAAVGSAMKDAAKNLQKSFDSLGRQYRGKPVSTIKAALKRELARHGGSASERELTEWATHISEGRRIVLKV